MAETQPRHALSECVATLLPGPAQCLLLAGCLDRGEPGANALHRWLALPQDPLDALTKAPVKWLMPLVLRAAAHHGNPLPSGLATVLRTATLREELRTPSYQAIRGHLLRGLENSDIHPIVLKGAALADCVYPGASLRHTHDVELLIRPDEWHRLPTAVADLGLNVTASDFTWPIVTFKHSSGLPLVLHRRLFRVPFYNRVDDDVWMRAESVSLGGVKARTLSPADMLLHVCACALHSPSHATYRWLVDAWFLLDRRGDLDWEALLRAASTCHLTLPLALSLEYLAVALRAPVPRAACDGLVAAAAADRSVGPELALHGARAAAGGLVTLMRQTRTFRGRVAIARHLLMPSLAFLWWSTQPRAPWLRAAHFQCFRVARYAQRQMAGWGSRLTPGA